jgi:hypothetical protein
MKSGRRVVLSVQRFAYGVEGVLCFAWCVKLSETAAASC